MHTHTYTHRERERKISQLLETLLKHNVSGKSFMQLGYKVGIQTIKKRLKSRERNRRVSISKSKNLTTVPSKYPNKTEVFKGKNLLNCLIFFFKHESAPSID